MKNRFIVLMAPIIFGSVAFAPYRVDTSLTLSQACAQEPRQPSGSFDLDIDHVAQTITTQETAIYFIEVSRQDTSEQPINLSVVSPDSSLSYKLEPQQISKTGLVKLSVRARNVSGSFNQFPIVVKAQMASSTGEVARCISTWLFVVAPAPSQTIVTLAVRPKTSLPNGGIEPLEGRIVPPKPGNVVLALLNPDQVLKKIPLSVDSLGRFSHNHVYRKPGPWQAAVLSEAGSDSLNSLISGAPFAKLAASFGNNRPISFQVAKRKPRIAVTTIDPRDKKIGDQLQIDGQLVADTANVEVQIKVVSPQKDTTTLYATSDAETGKFRAFYTIADSGLHTIIASALQLQIQQPPSCGEVIERTTSQIKQPNGASHDGGRMPALEQQGRGPNQEGEAISVFTASATDTAPQNSQPIGEAQAQVGAANSYAIIVVGGSTGNESPLLYKQNNIAASLYKRLKIRGFADDDILLLSQSECVEGYLKRDGRSCDLQAEITNFFSSGGRTKAGKNLLVYLVGRVVEDPPNSYKYFLYDDPLAANQPAPSCTSFTFDDLADEFKNNFFSDFRMVVCMVEFDNGGVFLSKLPAKITGTTPPKITTLSRTGNANKLDVNDWDYPEAAFAAKFAKKISEGFNITDAFYGIYNDFYAKAAMLDDNGSNNGTSMFKPDGSFVNKINEPANPGRDGINSEEALGINPGSGLASVFIFDGNLAASPVGPLLSRQAKVWAALDNPNQFPITSCTATIFRPDSSVEEVPLAFDSTSGAFKSKPVCFPDSGRYRFNFNVAYIAKDGEKFGSFDFEKIQYSVAPPDTNIEPPPIFFDPHIEAGFNFGRGFDPGSVRGSQNKPSGVIDVNFYSTRGGNLEFLGLGVASNFDRFWGVFMPVSVSAGGSTTLSNFWIYSGFGYDLGNAKFIRQDLLYFVGLKYRLFSLKH